jgi:hypothetical protein
MTFLSAFRRTGFAFGVAATLRAAPACAGELHKASTAVHGPSSPGASSSNGSSSSASNSGRSSSSDEASSSANDDTGDPSLFGQIAGALFVDVVLSPFTLPHAALEAGPAPPGGWSLLSRPYEGGARGYFVHVAPTSGSDASPDDVPEPDLRAISPDARRDVAFQLAAEGMLPAEHVGRVQARARLLTVTRFDLDTAYARYFEEDSGGGATSAWSGQTHVTYRFAQGERAQFRAGLGLRHWADDRGSTFGLDLIYGVDIFWARPITTSLEVTGGWVGDAWAFGARATLGVVLGHGELYAGYDATWMGDTAASGATANLGGPVAGVRAYF